MNKEPDVIEIPKAKVAFVTNKDLLREMHLSKNSYCEYTDKRYMDYDFIVNDLNELKDEDTLTRALEGRASRLSKLAHRDGLGGDPMAKARDFKVGVAGISVDDLVIRLMTYNHIPIDSARRKKQNSDRDRHVKLNFPPFMHYAVKRVDDELTFTEVGRSHHHEGEFSTSHGRITDKLTLMFILMTDRYGSKSNWRQYSYLDEMKGRAVVQFAELGLKFDESKGDNPFAYYTTLIYRSFCRIASAEKTVQRIRDDLLMDAGFTPSSTRQNEIANEISRLRDGSDEH